jgi:hypothetical protein
MAARMTDSFFVARFFAFIAISLRTVILSITNTNEKPQTFQNSPEFSRFLSSGSLWLVFGSAPHPRQRVQEGLELL